MQTEYRLDLSSPEHQVAATVSSPEEIEGEFATLLDSVFSNTAVVVNAQGLSDGKAVASMTVTLPAKNARGRSRRYELDVRFAHMSVWRVLGGLLHAYDDASMTLESIHLVESSKKARNHPDEEILRLPYLRARQVRGFEVEREESAGHDASVEIELRPRTKGPLVEQLTSTLNSWLAVCQGGFFNDDEEPVTNAHDCPGVENAGGGLLVARFEGYSGSPAAFDVALNIVDFFHQQFGCIKSVRMY